MNWEPNGVTDDSAIIPAWAAEPAVSDRPADSRLASRVLVRSIKSLLLETVPIVTTAEARDHTATLGRCPPGPDGRAARRVGRCFSRRVLDSIPTFTRGRILK